MNQDKMIDDLPSLVEQKIKEHPGYAEFAAWCQNQLIHPRQIYFLIWQASRAAVVIEMPDPPYMPDSDPQSMTCYEIGEAQGRCDMWARSREAIEAAGLKVKP